MIESLADYGLMKQTGNDSGVIKNVGIVGGGSMGQEIAIEVSKAGMDVVLLDITEERLKKIDQLIGEQIDLVIERWGMTKGEKKAIMSRIKYTTDYNELADCHIVIECINTEQASSNLDERKSVFRKIEAVVPQDTIIASNASTVLIADLSVVLKYPDRSIGLHFLSPVASVSIVEVNKCIITSNDTTAKVDKFVKMLKKEIIHVTASPGNISTRLIIPLINEACELLMEGVGTIEDIDHTLMQGFGMQMGPFALADKIGLDKLMKWMEGLYEEYGDKKYKTSPIIKRMVRANLFGKRMGEGFYLYENGKRIPKKGSLLNLGKE